MCSTSSGVKQPCHSMNRGSMKKGNPLRSSGQLVPNIAINTETMAGLMPPSRNLFKNSYQYINDDRLYAATSQYTPWPLERREVSSQVLRLLKRRLCCPVIACNMTLAAATFTHKHTTSETAPVYYYQPKDNVPVFVGMCCDAAACRKAQRQNRQQHHSRASVSLAARRQ